MAKKKKSAAAAGGKPAARPKPGVKPKPGDKPKRVARTFGPEDPRRAWIVFAVGAAVASLVFFASFILDRNLMIFGTDMISEAYQARSFAVQEVHAGRGLPHWNPFVYAGMPYLSILPYPVWYPTSLLYFVIDLHRAIGWAFVFHLFLAGLLAYALARELRMAPGAAAVVGVSYMFTGYIVSHLYAGQDGRMFAMQLTPALFLFAERAIARRRAHWFLWMGLVAALQVFTPHVQMMYFAAMGVGAFVVFRLAQVWREDRAWKPIAILGGSFLGAYLLAGLMTLVEVWPTLDIVQFTHRAERDYAYGSSWAMPVQESLAAVWPSFQGYLDTYWGTNPFKLHTEYLGAVPVLLAILALAARRTARVWFFAGLALGGLFFAWGSATPLHRVAWWLLPMMKSFRAPAMMYSIVALAVVVLAGYGAQALYDRRDRLADGRHVAWKILGGLGIVWILLWLWAAGSPQAFVGFWGGLLYGGLDPQRAALAERAVRGFVVGLGLFAAFWACGLAVAWTAARGRIAPVVACAVLAGIALVDLWRVGRDFYSTVPVAQVADGDAAVRFLQAQPGPFRVLQLPDTYGPNDLMVFRIPSATGSQKFRLRWWDDLVGEDMSRLGELTLWPLLNIQYVISNLPLAIQGLDIVHQGSGPLVYRWPPAQGGAWVVHEARARRPDEPSAQPLLDPAFDAYRTAILEPGTAPPALAAPSRPTRLRWDAHDPDRLALEVDTSADGLLVLSEAYHPYWRATVDGRPAPVLQVDGALRGVPLPAGRHKVVLTFADPAVARGAWGSAVGLLLWIGLVGATWKRRTSGERSANA
jgi:hypothetical protein